MKKVALFITLVYCIVCQTLIFGGELQDKSRSFSVNKGGKLEVTVNSGDIRINVWDRNEVLVKIERDSEDEDNKVNMTQSGNTVRVNDNGSWGGSSDYRITVPNQFNLDLKTTSGDISISGKVSGQVTVNTSGGDITSGSIGGNIDANTSGGDIHVGDVSGTADLNTMGGDIYAGIVSGQVKVQTMGGEISIKGSNNTVKAVTYGGDIKIGSAGSSIETTTYGGNIEAGNISGSAKVNTYGGDITITSASGDVDAKTAGGNLKLYNISGSITAKTSSGDVSAELIPGNKKQSKISSSNGSITLAVPANAKATINARIRLRGNWRDEDENYQIRSEFKAQKYSKDNNGKDIIAVYELNGGGEEINLEAINSDIIIKRMINK